MEEFKKLYIITGKGGVGKTTTAFALCKYLQQKNRKTYYIYLGSSTLREEKENHFPEKEMAKELGVEFKELDLAECAQTYIAKKLKSSMVASWIVKTPFFKALVNMMPGFSYLIYLGRILETIKDGPENISIVLDSPSSGHALTMLESTKNFQEIFQSGIVFEDTKTMLSLLSSEGFAQVNIICLPTKMAIHEGVELADEISKTIKIKKKLFCNNLLDIGVEQIEELPDFLKQKLENERIVLEEHQEHIDGILPHCPSLDSKEIIDSIVPKMENLV